MIEFKLTQVPTRVKGYVSRSLFASLALMASSSVLLLSGCSSAFKSVAPQPTGAVHVAGIKGKVHGGQQPVSNSTIQIYEVSAAGAGYGAASAAVEESGTIVTATTDSNGSFSYPAYTCTSGSDFLYIVASGGNPLGSGFPGTNNTALVLTAVLGSCSNLASIQSSFVVINEVTTVATSYSLSGFMTDYLHVGTSSTNTVGLTNAFATFTNLVNVGSGQALTVTPAYAVAPANTSPDVFGSIVPYDTINTLANILSSCVNTDGTGAACSTLFSTISTNGTATVSNTSDAALYIAHNPGLPTTNGEINNVSALYGLSPAQAPFQPALSGAPNDFTLTLNFIGGGLGGVKTNSRSGAKNIAIDKNGNLWLPNSFRTSVTELSNLGAPLSPTTTTNQTTPFAPIALGGWGATAGVLAAPETVAIDQNGNAWIADNVNCLVGFNSSGTPLTGSPFTGACPSGSGAYGVSVDAGNLVWAAGEAFITATNNSGTLQSGFPVTSGFETLTGFLGADYTGHTWYIDGGNNHYGALNSNGSFFTTSASSISGPGPYAAFGSLATSAGGNSGLALWVPEGSGGTLNIQPINVTGSINNLPGALLPNTEAGPQGIAADGASNYYFVNDGGTNGSTAVPANLSVLSQKGSLISPFPSGYTGGTGLTVLGSPIGVAVDQSGNVWVVNENNDNPTAGLLSTSGTGHSTVTEFVGLAVPVQPVNSVAALNGAYATKP